MLTVEEALTRGAQHQPSSKAQIFSNLSSTTCATSLPSLTARTVSPQTAYTKSASFLSCRWAISSSRGSQKGLICLLVRKNLFIKSMTKTRGMVEALPLEIPGTQLDNVLNKLLCMTPLSMGLYLPPPEMPSHLRNSAILRWAVTLGQGDLLSWLCQSYED